MTPDKHVAVEMNKGPGVGLHVLDRETLQLTTRRIPTSGARPRCSLAAHRRLGHRFGHPSLSEPVGDGAVRQLDRILEAKTGELRCVLSAGNLPDLTTRPRQGVLLSVRPPMRSPTGAAQPGAAPSSTIVLSWGKTSRWRRCRRAKISPDYPLAAGLRACWTGRGQETVLEFFNLGLGETIGSIDLSDSRNEPNQPGITFVRDTVLVSRGSRLMFLAIPAEVRKDLVPPLMLKYPRIDVASVAKPLTVQFATVGGDGHPAFGAGEEIRGTHPGRGDGQGRHRLARDLENMPALPEPGQQQMALVAQAEFRRLTGRPLPPETFAFALPLEVSVSDAEGQQDRLNLAVIVLATAEDFDNAAEEPPSRPGARQGTVPAPPARAVPPPSDNPFGPPPSEDPFRRRPPNQFLDEAAADRPTADFPAGAARRRWPD